MTRPQNDGGYGFDEKDLYASVYHEDDEAIALEAGRRAPRRPHRAPREEGQLLEHGRPRPGRTVLRDPHRPGPRVRCRPRLGGGGPLPRVLEPRVHAGRPVRGAGQGRLRHHGYLRKRNIGLALVRGGSLPVRGVDNLYEIDEVFPVIAVVEDMRSPAALASRTTSDASSSPTACAPALMLIGDGVTPGNEAGATCCGG